MAHGLGRRALWASLGSLSGRLGLALGAPSSGYGSAIPTSASSSDVLLSIALSQQELDARGRPVGTSLLICVIEGTRTKFPPKCG